MGNNEKLLKEFDNDPLAIFKGKYDDYRAIGLSEVVSNNLASWRQLFSVQVEKERLSKLKARFISFENESYPPLLKSIYDPPHWPVLLRPGRILSQYYCHRWQPLCVFVRFASGGTISL